MSRVPESVQDRLLPWARKFVGREVGHLAQAPEVEEYAEGLAERLAHEAQDFTDDVRRELVARERIQVISPSYEESAF